MLQFLLPFYVCANFIFKLLLIQVHGLYTDYIWRSHKGGRKDIGLTPPIETAISFISNKYALYTAQERFKSSDTIRLILSYP